MKNLKKVLCLTLVFAMAFGLMISASATTFSDKADIKNTDAVALLDSLNIMQGNADGKFDPQGVLTRAQIAKMIYVARTGGVDDQAVLYKGTSNTFSDTKGHWAEGYINYAAAKGFVAGRGNGKFDPNASITGFELMKIALCALGYDAEIEGFVGGSWKANVASMAQEAGLTLGYTADPAAPITRDNAAGIFKNLVYATVIEYNEGVAKHRELSQIINNQVVTTPYTFGGVYLNLLQDEGVMVANDAESIDGYSVAGEGYIRITDATDKVNGSTYNVGKYDVVVPENFFGQTVTVLYRVDSNKKITKIFGVNASTEMNKVTDINFGTVFGLNEKNLDGAKYYVNYDELTGKSYYTTDKGFNYKIAVDMSKFNIWNFATAGNAIPARAVDNNGDGKYDYIFETTLQLAKVASVISGTVTLSNINANSITGAITTSPCADKLTSANATGIDKLAKDDIVVYRQYGTTYKVEKCESFEGKVDSFAYDLANSSTYVTLDGVKYSTAGGVNGTSFLIYTNRKVGLKGKYFSYGGKLVYTTDVDETVPNYALVKYSDYSYLNGAQVVLLLDTGVTGTYKVKSYNNDTTKVTETVFAHSKTEFVKDTIGDNDEEIVEYTLNDDGSVNICDAAKTVATDVPSVKYTKSASLLTGNYYVSSSTVAFIKSTVSGVDYYYVYKGLGTIPSVDNATMDYVGGKELSSPMYYTNAVFFDDATFAAVASTDYYVVTSALATIDKDGNTQFTAYLNDEAVTLKATPAATTKISPKNIYLFTFDSNGYVSDATPVVKAENEGYAVTTAGDQALVLARITGIPTPDQTANVTTSVSVYSVNSGTKYYYVDTTAGTVKAVTKADLVTYDLATIQADVDNYFTDWAFKMVPVAKHQIEVIENDAKSGGDEALDVVYIFSAPLD